MAPRDRLHGRCFGKPAQFSMLLGGRGSDMCPAVDFFERRHRLAKFDSRHGRLAEADAVGELLPCQAGIQAKAPQRQAKAAKRLWNVTRCHPTVGGVRNSLSGSEWANARSRCSRARWTSLESSL